MQFSRVLASARSYLMGNIESICDAVVLVVVVSDGGGGCSRQKDFSTNRATLIGQPVSHLDMCAQRLKPLRVAAP